MSFLFRRIWFALFLLSIFFCSFLCFLVSTVTDTLPVRQGNRKGKFYFGEEGDTFNQNEAIVVVKMNMR